MGERERKTEKREGSINVTLTSLFCFIFYQVREIRGKKASVKCSGLWTWEKRGECSTTYR